MVQSNSNPHSRLYSKSDKERIGNTLNYFAEKVHNLSKTKALKLLYLLDEYTTVQTGVPFLGLSYEVWRNGPVNQDVFYELSNELLELKKYVAISYNKSFDVIVPKKEFDDHEFSDHDMAALEHILEKNGRLNANELIDITHKKGGLWDRTASKHGLKEVFKNNTKTHTSNYILNLEDLLVDEIKKRRYKDYLEDQRIEQMLNA